MKLKTPTQQNLSSIELARKTLVKNSEFESPNNSQNYHRWMPFGNIKGKILYRVFFKHKEFVVYRNVINRPENLKKGFCGTNKSFSTRNIKIILNIKHEGKTQNLI